MDVYEASSCSIGNFLFTFGSSAYAYMADVTPAAASNVLVTPTGTGAVGSQTGFVFTVIGGGNAWQANFAGNGYADINLAFQVGLVNTTHTEIDSGTMALDVNITNPDGNGNLVLGAETVGGPGGGAINLTVFANNNGASTGYVGGTPLSGTAGLANTSFTISKDILVGALTGGTTTVNSVTETFTYTNTPEPGPFVLTATSLGLLLLAWRRKSLRRFFGLVALVVVLSLGAAHAAPLCTAVGGSTQHLSDLITVGQCTVGDILFTFNGSSFSESGNAGVKPATDGSNITVNELSNSNGIGFHFIPVFLGLANQSEAFTITFTAQTASNSIVGFYGSDSVSTSGTGSFPTAQSEVQNGASDVSVNPPGQNPILFPSGVGGSGFPVFASAIAPGTLLTFTDTFSFSVGATGSAHFSDAVMELTEPLQAVPEPVTSLLTGSAFLLVAMVMRRKAAHKA
jgi:hypothetical protein